MVFFKTRLLSCVFCLLTVTVAVTGCRIWDDNGPGEAQLTLTVRAYDVDGNEVTIPVHDVTLYVFDEDLRFIREVETSVGVKETIPVPEGGVHIVGWGNLKGGSEMLPQLSPGDRMDMGLVRLVHDSHAASLCISPDNLFWGELTIAAADMRGDKLIPIRSKVGTLAVTVKGLKEYAGYDDADYHIEVRENYDALDFYGICCGEEALYDPDGTFRTVSGRELYDVDDFNMIAEEGVSVEIYHGSTLVYTATATTGGTPIQVMEGRRTLVDISFEGTVTVGISITDWDVNNGGKDF